MRFQSSEAVRVLSPGHHCRPEQPSGSLLTLESPSQESTWAPLSPLAGPAQKQCDRPPVPSPACGPQMARKQVFTWAARLTSWADNSFAGPSTLS